MTGRPVRLPETGQLYAAESNRRYWWRASISQGMWEAVAWGLGIVAVFATGIGLAVMWVAPFAHGHLAMGLVGVGLVLLAVAAFAWLRSDQVPEPPAMAIQQVRWHIDDAPTVLVGERRPRRKR